LPGRIMRGGNFDEERGWCGTWRSAGINYRDLGARSSSARLAVEREEAAEDSAAG